MDDLLEPIAKVFAHKLLRIPDYQRGYAWEERQWEDFINDIEYLPKDKMHFTGTVVIHKQNGDVTKFQDNQFNTYEYFDVVDGQQRLTTAVILLLVLRQEMLQFDELKGFGEGILRNYIEVQDRNGQPIPRLALNRDCQDFFYRTVLERGTDIQGPKIQSHILLARAKVFFSEQRLVTLLSSHRYQSTQEIVYTIMSQVEKFQDEANQADDVTLLVVQFFGQPKEMATPDT